MMVIGTVTWRLRTITRSGSQSLLELVIKLALVCPKNASLSYRQICCLTCLCRLCRPLCLADLFCCCTLLLCVCLSVKPGAVLAWTRAQEIDQSSVHCRAIHLPVAIGTHFKVSASQSLRTMGRVLETCRVFVAMCKMWPMSFLSWDRADVAGSKLTYLHKPGANAQTWSGRSAWKVPGQEVSTWSAASSSYVSSEASWEGPNPPWCGIPRKLFPLWNQVKGRSVSCAGVPKGKAELKQKSALSSLPGGLSCFPFT